MFLPSNIVFLCLVCVPTVIVADECSKGCPHPINLYEQLKCVPKYDKPTDCCPKRYDCTHIHNRPEKTCHLRGKLYKPGDRVAVEDIAENCKINCKCSESLEFSCLPVQQDCQEYYRSDYPKEGCYLPYKLDQCCASGEICPPFDKIAKCEVNGTIYKEGQRFLKPDDPCTKCVCNKHFDGKFLEPYCQKRNCTTEIDYSADIDKFCAPFYLRGRCCPAWWICPSSGGQYIQAPTTGVNSDLRCQFGTNFMEIGSKYLYKDEHTSKIACECIIPPYLTCFEES